MRILYELAKRLQFIDRAVPERWRVPFRYTSQKIFGGLEPEMQLLPELVAKDAIAIDVGGNRGTYTYALAKLSRQVITFEPIPDCAAMIKAWAANRNVRVHECALGEREDILALHLPRLHGKLVTTRASISRTDGEGIDISVPIKKLDQFELEDVGFIKIDVEGFELATLRGAAELLRKSRPKLLIEIDPLQQSPAEFRTTFAWLEERGYQGYYLSSDGLQPCDSSIQSTHPNFYNFVFLPVVSA